MKKLIIGETAHSLSQPTESTMKSAEGFKTCLRLPSTENLIWEKLHIHCRSHSQEPSWGQGVQCSPVFYQRFRFDLLQNGPSTRQSLKTSSLPALKMSEYCIKHYRMVRCQSLLNLVCKSIVKKRHILA